MLPIQWCYTMELYLLCVVLPIQWGYTVELYLFVRDVLWCVANTVMLYYGIVFICMERVVMCCQYSDVILWNCIYLYGTCCDVLPIQWCYTMELYLFVWNVLWCVANTVMLYYGILWNCIYLYGTCCDMLPIQWCYTMELL